MQDDNTSRLFQWIALGFMLAGCGLLIAGWFEYRSTAAFLRNAVSTTGVVTSNHRSTNSKGEASYYPVVQFATTQGESIEFRSRSGSSSPTYSVGTTVPVLYAPSQPANARIRSFFALWLGTIIFSVLGVGFSSMGMLAFRIFANDQKVLRSKNDATNPLRVRRKPKRAIRAKGSSGQPR